MSNNQNEEQVPSVGNCSPPFTGGVGGGFVKEALAIASFIVATIIVIFCLIVPPRGEIDSSALWAAAQFLVMCCSLLEIQATIEKFLKRK